MGDTAPAPLTFREFIALVNPDYTISPYHEALIDLLQRVGDGEPLHLALALPWGITQLLAGYYVYRWPERWVATVGLLADIADAHRRDARDFYRSAGGVVAHDSTHYRNWQTQSGGGVWASGAGGGISGRGFHLGIVWRSPNRGSLYEKSRWKDWFYSQIETREMCGGAIVVVDEAVDV
ncbi:MAG TPA: hypothetical protein VFS21_30155 [Roseiflexaceae bacterium]|nr:hypothetical protein [Roseiflexaceae bacterium]